jgi:hypothetical protein
MDSLWVAFGKAIEGMESWQKLFALLIVIGYLTYSKFENGRAMRILNKTVAGLVQDLSQRITFMTSRIEALITERK